MEVKDFICFCGKLGNLELPDRYASDVDGKEALQDARVQGLLVALNGVLEEVCYVAGEVRRCNVVAENGKIDLSGFNVSRVLRLSSFDSDVSYRLSANGLYVQTDGEFQLTYVVCPPKATWKGQFVLPMQLGQTAMAAGVLGYYFLSAGDLTQGSAWLERYRDASGNCFKKRSGMTMPVGRWLC